ncbi:MAG: hypothetical protein AAF682_16050 [Planctomycetota bacterium]
MPPRRRKTARNLALTALSVLAVLALPHLAPDAERGEQREPPSGSPDASRAVDEGAEALLRLEQSAERLTAAYEVLGR